MQIPIPNLILISLNIALWDRLQAQRSQVNMELRLPLCPLQRPDRERHPCIRSYMRQMQVRKLLAEGKCLLSNITISDHNFFITRFRGNDNNSVNRVNDCRELYRRNIYGRVRPEIVAPRFYTVLPWSTFLKREMD